MYWLLRRGLPWLRTGLELATWRASRWSGFSMASTRTWPRIFCWGAGFGRAWCFAPTTTGRCRRWWRQAWALRWRRCSPWTRPTRRCSCSSSPKPCRRACSSCCGIGIAIGRRRWPLSSTRRSPCRPRSSGRMTRSSLSLFWLLDREHELEAVDLVVLRPDLLEAEAAYDRQRGRVVGRYARVDLLLCVTQRPPDQGARGLFGEALAAVLREDGVADLGAADNLGWPVKAAVPDNFFVARDHEARHPVALAGICLHAMQLDGEESGDVVLGRKFLRQVKSLRALGFVAIAFDEMPYRIGVHRDELEALGSDRLNRHCSRLWSSALRVC